MKLILTLFCCIGASLALDLNRQWSSSQRKQLWRISPQTEADVEALKEYESQLDFWTQSRLGQYADVMVDSSLADILERDLVQRGISWTVQIDDIDAEIKSQKKQMDIKKQSIGVKALGDFDYTVYHPYEEIQQWVQDMASEYEYVETFFMAMSYEGRAINGIKIHADAAAGASDPRPAIWFEGGIHAREWISPATVMYFTNELCKQFNLGDARVKRVLGMFDFYIVPSLNADGYAYTWINTDTRLWRKTRKTNVDPNSGEDFGCIGTDPNRNWNIFWGRDGASPWPCSDTFRGFSPFDNLEVQGVDDYITSIVNGPEGQKFKVFIDWHSYSQLILAPWSYDSTAELPPDTDAQIAAATAMADAINMTTGKTYTVGPSARLLYEASGASNDYGYGGTPMATYTYVVELRDEGNYGFILPADQILPTGQESYAAVLALCDYVIDNDYSFA